MIKYLTLDLNKKRHKEFFAENLFADRDEWRRERREKEAELKAVRELKAISQSEVHSGNISNPTQNSTFAAMRIEEEISKYEYYEYVVEYGLSHISQEDREIIETFYFTKHKMKSALIDNLCHKLSIEPRQVYYRKRNAIYNFVDAVREIINE